MHEKYTGRDRVHTAEGTGMHISHTGYSTLRTPYSSFDLNDILHVPRNRRNLTSGRDLEGELVHRGSIFILLRSGRPRHRSSSTTTASPPSPSIPSTSHIDLVIISVLVVDLYKYYSFMISSIIIAMMRSEERRVGKECRL